jgi:hypothetical protein
MTEPDPIQVAITARFADLEVVKSRGGYTLVDARSATRSPD